MVLYFVFLIFTYCQWRRSGVFIVNFELISHFFSVSIVEFEQVNVSWNMPNAEVKKT